MRAPRSTTTGAVLAALAGAAAAVPWMRTGAGTVAALLVLLGLVPLAATRATRPRPGDRPAGRTRRDAVLGGVLAAGLALAAAGVLLAAPRGFGEVRLALLSLRTAVVAVWAWAPLVVAALGVAAALAATGALRRRRGPVLAAAVVVSAAAALTALLLLARTAVDVVVLVRYDVPPASAVPWDLVLGALVAGVAGVVALVVAVRVRVLLPD
ncbi:hypothetical protein [Cellulomonas sp.]|uniref:hypothetical protein n=1 Tax=Cellulomonas sp. TaxID=40001 RepID=UPI0028118091|nr:hypothetical protein [Cellulomonas sp.]